MNGFRATSAVDDGRVRQECLRQAVPLVRGLTLTSPVSVGLMLLLTRPGIPAGALWATLLLVPSLCIVALTPRATAPTPALLRWEVRVRIYLVVNLVTWASALALLRPPVDEPAVQTAQLLVLVAVANALVLIGAFLPRTFHLAIGVFGASIVVGLAIWGIGFNRFLVLAIPVYLVVLVQLQLHMRGATVRSIRLALENETLLRELGHEQERLEHEASHDQLTGLFNRSAFLELVDRRVALAPEERCTALAFLDLDRFKEVNDAHGHVVGDLLLTEVGQRLRGAVRAGDIVGRFGGDEFTVLLGDVPDAATARLAGERIVAAFDDPFLVDGLVLGVGMSVGVAAVTGRSVTADELVRMADRAVYAAKSEGRHRVSVEEITVGLSAG
jgi:diguanylate cyclase (GGDEF)-like protein